MERLLIIEMTVEILSMAAAAFLVISLIKEGSSLIQYLKKQRDKKMKREQDIVVSLCERIKSIMTDTESLTEEEKVVLNKISEKRNLSEQEKKILNNLPKEMVEQASPAEKEKKS